MKILVTGCSGFIGYHLCLNLLKYKKNVVHGIDNLNNYYDIKLKKNRLSNLKKQSKKFLFIKKDISNLRSLKKIFLKGKFDYVINLAAQAGVRYSIKNPSTYFNSNIIGFFNILECSRIFKIKHLIFASTSSVYGNSKNFPLKENEKTDSPLSFYAATKKSNEVMAHSYSNIYKLPCTGLRFFTVYGPYGRPDMSLFLFTDAILKRKKINLFNKGNHIRDFTFVDDVVTSINKIIKKPSKNKIPYEVFNIASSNPVHLKFFLKNIEKGLGKKTNVQFQEMQKGDIFKTHGSVNKIVKKTKFKPKVKIKTGIEEFLKWYKKYYKFKN